MGMSYTRPFDSTRSVGQYLNKTRLGSIHHEIFKDNFGFVISNSCILSTMTYSSQAKKKLATAQTLKEVF